MKFIDCTYELHAPEILAIFNHAILNTTALWEYKARTTDTMKIWFETKSAGNFPVIGALDEQGTLIGFASYGTFRPWAAYKYSVEHSVYLRQDQQGKGLGKLFMQELIQRAKTQGFHTIIGAIDADNKSSIAFHENLGFEYAGTLKQAGYKFGRWLDFVFYQLILETPLHPTED
ncbi:MAG: N-acetyltransferase family protein [Gammaproteobacteria bacterium]|nr:MAG: N-acetyltransferase family protein [Gammaproteobacteria bacterium]